jgi:hypothetical protein
MASGIINRAGSTPASYAEGPVFKYQAGGRILWLKFVVVFVRSSIQILGYKLKIRPRFPFPCLNGIFVESGIA